MIASEVVTITREEYATLSDKAQKWDNITDERITFIAWRTAEQWEQFVEDARWGAASRESAESYGVALEDVKLLIQTRGGVPND